MGGPTVESLAGRVGQWWPGVALGNTDRGTAVSRGPSLTWLVRVGGDLQFGWWASWLQPAASGGEWHGPQPRQGGEELGFPRPAPGQMQYEAPGLAGDASGQGKEAPPEGLGGRHRLSQSDAPGPAGQVVGHDLYRQPGSVGREAPRGEMIEPHAVLEVPDGVLDLGVAAVVGLQFQGIVPGYPPDGR